MKMNKRRMTAVALVLLLCFSAVPITAFAVSGVEYTPDEIVADFTEASAPEAAEVPADESVPDTTEEPFTEPSEMPTEAPTEIPTEEPSEMPTEEPTEIPTEEPEEEPEFPYEIQIDEIDGYHNTPVELTIRIEDENDIGWEKAEVSTDPEDMELRIDLTEELLENEEVVYEVSENGTLYFFITDFDGNEYMDTYEVEFFDYDPPILEAGIRNTVLQVESYDALSGVAGIYVNDQLYTTLKNGLLELPIEGCTEEELFYIQAVDTLGNSSKYLVLSNPFYREPVEEPTEAPHTEHCPADCDCRKQQTTTPVVPSGGGSSGGSNSGGSSSGNTSSGNSTQKNPSEKENPATEPVTKEPGTGFSQNGSAVHRDLLYYKYTNKPIITITDREGNTFYMVIDYDSPINEKEEQYQTYFLNPVDLADLNALAGNDTAAAVCSCRDRCQAGAVNMTCEICSKDMTACIGKEPEPVVTEEPTEPPVEEPEDKGGTNPAALGLLLILLGGGGALAYNKLVKNKPQTKGNADLDDYDYGDEDDDEYEDAPVEHEDGGDPEDQD